MTPDDPEIVHCPSCEATLVRSLRGSTIIRIKSGWYDGDLENDLQLSASRIAKCPYCQHVYRSDDAEIAKDQTVAWEYWGSADCQDDLVDAKDTDEPLESLPLISPWELEATISDYQYAVDHRLAKSSDEELAFLIKVWQMAKHHTRPLFDKIAHLQKIDPIDTSLKKEIEEYIAEIEAHEINISKTIAGLESTPALADEVINVWLDWRKENPDPLGRHRESWKRHSNYYISKLNEDPTATPSVAERIGKQYVEQLLTSYIEDDAALNIKLFENITGFQADSPLYTVEDLDACERRQALRDAITLLCPLPDIFPSKNVVELMGPPHEIFREGENFLNSLRSIGSQLLTAGEIAARVDDAIIELVSFEFQETDVVYLMRLANLLIGRNNLLAADLFRQLGKFDQALSTLDVVDLRTLSKHGLDTYRSITSQIGEKSTATYRYAEPEVERPAQD